MSALLSTGTVSEAARVCECSETSIYRWLNTDKVFQDAYADYRQQQMQAATGFLQATTCQAVGVLREIMLNPDGKETARVTAARAVLDLAIRATAVEELQKQVDELEAAINGDIQMSKKSGAAYEYEKA